MANLAPIQLEDGTTIYIQTQGDFPVSEPSNAPQEKTRADLDKEGKGLREMMAGASKMAKSIPSPQEQAVQTFQVIEDTIRGYTHYTLNAFKKVANANIDKVTLEFGIQIEGKVGVPYITEGTAASNLKVTVECSFSD